MQLAADNKVESIAFPNISTGIYGFPKEKAAEIALRTVREFLSGNDRVKRVTFVCFDDDNYSLYLRINSNHEDTKTRS